MFAIEPSWQKVLKSELEKPYIKSLKAFLEEEYKHPVYPPQNVIFEAFRLTPFEQVKVVIVGQDPYHGPNQAHGLSFSVPVGEKLPPSLKNIYKELQADLGMAPPVHGCLEAWAKQGVFLLNATLTVRKGQPLSHHNKGWEEFTDHVIKTLDERENPLVFVLWGQNAEKKGQFLNSKQHLVLKAAHPSPFSAHRGFLGCRHFSQINAFFTRQNLPIINWSIT